MRSNLLAANQQSKDLSGGMDNLDSRVVEVIPRSFAQKVSKYYADYWDTDDGSWLCTGNDVDHVAAKIHNQHHKR
jgi:hypothetical protein